MQQRNINIHFKCEDTQVSDGQWLHAHTDTNTQCLPCVTLIVVVLTKRYC